MPCNLISDAHECVDIDLGGGWGGGGTVVVPCVECLTARRGTLIGARDVCTDRYSGRWSWV